MVGRNIVVSWFFNSRNDKEEDDHIRYNSGLVTRAFKGLFGLRSWWKPKLEKDQKFYHEKKKEIPEGKIMDSGAQVALAIANRVLRRQHSYIYDTSDAMW